MTKISTIWSTFSSVLLLSLLSPQAIYAFPFPPKVGKPPPMVFPFNETTESSIDFSAIVSLNNCSGSLIKFTTSVPEDKAIILTNGHCYEGGFLKPGQVITNKSSTRTFDLLNINGTKDLRTFTAEKLLYATMTNTDISLYQLNKSYGDIKKLTGIDALILSERHPEAGTAVRIVSGYWRKIYSCSVKSFVPTLREGPWTFKDSIKYSQPGCAVIGGTSGSPIIDVATKEVIGVNNTTNESGRNCTLNNPCEVDTSGNTHSEKGAAYGQETSEIYSCLREDNSFDLNKQGCTLPKE